jgi:hypothetical protein
MQIDRRPFPVNKLDMVNPAILKNMVIGDPRSKENAE